MLDVRHEVITSIDALEDPIVSAHTSPMALQPGAIRAEWVHADLGTAVVEVGEYSFSFATHCETRADRVILLTPLRRGVFGQLNGEPLAPGVLHVGGDRAEVFGTFSGPAMLGIVSLPQESLVRTAQTLGFDLDIPPRGNVRRVRCADSFGLGEVFDTVRCVAREPVDDRTWEPDGPDLDTAVSEIVARSLASGTACEMPGALACRRSVSIVRACEREAARVQYQGVTIADLCNAAGVSERRIRVAFSDCYGLSPTGYLRIVALHAARHELREGPLVRDPVSRAASNFGFWHLSRFAGQYRALFGESPAETLDRSHELARAQ